MACLPASPGKSKTSEKDPAFYRDDNGFNYVYMCVSKYGYEYMNAGIHRAQQRASDAL